MVVATEAFGIFTALVFYKIPLAFQEFIFPPIIGLLVFEFLFRTRKWLGLKTLPVYIIAVTLISQILYSVMYNISYGNFLAALPLQSLIYEYPYNLYSLIEASIVTGLGYYLIKIYRHETWVISERQFNAEASNEPVFAEGPLTFSLWLQKNRYQIAGFFGWYVINIMIWLLAGSTPGNDADIFINLLLFPANILVLIILAIIKSARRVASGVLVALAFNLLVSLVMGASLNGWCFIPFIFPTN